MNQDRSGTGTLWSSSMRIRQVSGGNRGAQAVRGVFQDQLDLLAGYSGEPFQEFIDCGPALEIGKKSSHRYTGPPEHPCPTDPLRVTFNCRACRPIKRRKLYLYLLSPSAGYVGQTF